jgi:two-component system cell cycle response regulator
MSKLGIARRESMMDPLTRLWNRRGAGVMTKAALESANAQNSSVGIAVIDLDNFKQINDTYGHQIGDEVLRKTALRLIQSVRTDDTVCRIGGDEFLLIMKDTDSVVAKGTTQRMREVVAETPIKTRQGPITVTTSVGFTVRSGSEHESVDQLIEQADRALMRSKAEGRNQVVEFA